jgi:hypothetical protein
MTDQTPPPGRIDLRTLDDAHAGRADRVIRAAMSRIATSPEQAPRDAVAEVASRFTRPAIVAAAVLAAIAIGTLALTHRASASPAPETLLASWVESQHVPTNAELLQAFEGYGR